MDDKQNYQVVTQAAGPELDALIAERVMGWQWNIRNGVCYTEHDSFNSPDCWPKWCPSTDIADAWEVVEKLKEREPRGDLEFGIRGRSPEIVVCWDGIKWYCDWDGQGTMRGFHGVASTAPLAICLAALKAVDG